ncbi:hypothetical protein RJ640_030863 [Escallonia rubra]|uniref:Uncharacterized protein n=1 Tax=Escallonia rubra TaxID=112253 RepID=A0AA88QHB4_9ASTE|nr:hypothetical protein RJ640_030863 [Escallonia rubra]
MESSKGDVELIQFAIKQLMEQQSAIKGSSPDDSFVAADSDEDDHRLLLTSLLSQLETLRADGQLQQPEPSAYVAEAPLIEVGTVGRKSETMNEAEGASSGSRKEEEIVKELRNVKRQNLITHCLLSVMIVLTVAWQLSEVSLILKVKDGMSHPFRSFGNMVTGMLKGPNANNQEGEKQSSTPSMPIESSAPPGLKIPELPRMELPVFDVNNNED